MLSNIHEDAQRGEKRCEVCCSRIARRTAAALPRPERRCSRRCGRGSAGHRLPVGNGARICAPRVLPLAFEDLGPQAVKDSTRRSALSWSGRRAYVTAFLSLPSKTWLVLSGRSNLFRRGGSFSRGGALSLDPSHVPSRQSARRCNRHSCLMPPGRQSVGELARIWLV
jgi:hypothetical protein